MRLFLLCLLSVWLALPVFAQTSVDTFSNCGSPASAAVATGFRDVGQNGILCFDFDADFSTGASLSFFVARGRATVCMDPDRAGTGGSAVVDLQVCPSVDSPGDNTCVDTGLTLTLANPCEAVTRGHYRFEVTTAASGAEDAQIVVRGY